MANAVLPYSDIGGGLPPGPVPFNRYAWDDPRQHPLNRAYGDEFEQVNFEQLARRWKFHTAVKADFRFPGGSAIEWKPSASGSMLYIPIPSGDFEAVLEVSRHRTAARWDDMFGLGLVDASGNGVGQTSDYDGNSYCWQLTSWNYSGTGAAHTASNALEDGGTHVWPMIRKTGTTVKTRESGNGSTISVLTSGDTLGTTPLYLAIGRFIGNPTEWVTLHRLNVYSAPTYFTP